MKDEDMWFINAKDEDIWFINMAFGCFNYPFYGLLFVYLNRLYKNWIFLWSFHFHIYEKISLYINVISNYDIQS